MFRPIAVVLALAASTIAWGQGIDPPERIVRLSYVEGQVAFQGAGDVTATALPDRPLIPGDRLTTQYGGRAELALGTATLRLDEQSELFVDDLVESAVRLNLSRGTAAVQLHELLEDEVFEVATPNTTLALLAPGDYRLEALPGGNTELSVRSGVAEAATAGGTVRVAAGQRVRLEGSQALASLVPPLPADAFDNWVLDREVQLAELQPTGEDLYAEESYEELDRYGEWVDDPHYGNVWMPAYAYGGYDPFRYGHWQRVGFGWSWYDPMPWRYRTFHHGRWAYLDHLNRWCWVPERRARHDRDRFAEETHPFRLPRGDGRPTDRGKRERAPGFQPRDDDRDGDRPVATARENPRRLGTDRTPVFRRDVETVKRAAPRDPVGTLVRERSQPQRSTERSASPPRGGGSSATMRPSSPPAEARSTRSTESRSDTSSRPATARSRAFGQPQER